MDLQRWRETILKLSERFNGPPIREVEDKEYYMPLPSPEKWYLIPVGANRRPYRKENVLICFVSLDGFEAYEGANSFTHKPVGCLERPLSKIKDYVDHDSTQVQCAATFDNPDIPCVIYERGAE